MPVVLFIVLLLLINNVNGAKKPSSSPTQRPSQQIYGDSIDPVGLSSEAQQAILGVMTIGLFAGMLFEFKPPEILFLGAVMVCTILQILTLSQALSGMNYLIFPV